MSCDLTHQARTGPEPVRLVAGCHAGGGRKHEGTGHLGAAHLGVPERRSRRASARAVGPAPRPLAARRSTAVGEDWAGGRGGGRGLGARSGRAHV